MRILAEAILCKDLKPGDLFSELGPSYWDKNGHESDGSVGEKVYIKTNTVCPIEDEEIQVFKIVISL